MRIQRRKVNLYRRDWQWNLILLLHEKRFEDLWWFVRCQWAFWQPMKNNDIIGINYLPHNNKIISIAGTLLTHFFQNVRQYTHTVLSFENQIFQLITDILFIFTLCNRLYLENAKSFNLSEISYDIVDWLLRSHDLNSSGYHSVTSISCILFNA